MRQVVMAICILLVISAVCIGGASVISNVVDEMILIIEKADDSAFANDTEGLEKYSIEANEYWDQKEGLIGAIVRHDEVDDITLRLKSIEHFAVTGDMQSYFEESKVLKIYLKHLIEMEVPSLKNIF